MIVQLEQIRKLFSRYLTAPGIEEHYTIGRMVEHEPGLVTGYDVEPDEGDVEAAVRMLAAGETVVVGSRRFVDQIVARSPLFVEVWREDDLWELEAR